MDQLLGTPDNGFNGSDYDSSLEAGGSKVVSMPSDQIRTSVSPFRLDKTAFWLTGATIGLIALVVGASLLFMNLTSHKTNTANSQKPSNYNVSDVPASSISGSGQLQLAQADSLAVNGQLVVNKTLVLTPTSTPTSPTTGEVYYDKSTNQPYFYNGSQFVSLEGVSSLGGSSGPINLGDSLQISGNTLGVSSTFLQSVNSSINAPKVSSIQGLTGNVNLVAGNGIAISGATIKNNGVVSLTSNASSLIVNNDGNGNYTIDTTAGGTVVLGPSAPQLDASDNNAIDINKTGNGNLLNLAESGVATFVVDNTGAISAATTNTLNGVSINSGDIKATTGTYTGNLTLGVSNSTAGNLIFTNASTGHVTNLQALADNLHDQTITIPSSTQHTDANGNYVDTVCLYYAHNCTGTGGTVSSSGGTSGAIAYFSGTQLLNNSTISQDISGGATDGNITISKALTVSGSNGIYTPVLQSSGTLTITPGGDFGLGATNQKFNLQGNAGSTLKISAAGGTTTVGFVAPTGTRSINVPDYSGTICVEDLVGKTTNCDFATGSTGVVSIQGTNNANKDVINGALTLNNSSTVAATRTITIDSAGVDGDPTVSTGKLGTRGIASFTNTNFKLDGYGNINTVQDIRTGDSPTFAGLTLTGSGLVNNAAVDGTGNSNLKITSNNNNIKFSINGGAETFVFPALGGPDQTICTSKNSSTCVTGQGLGVLLNPSGIQTAPDSSVGIYINQTNASGNSNLLELQTAGTDSLVLDHSGTTTIKSLKTNTITPTGALTVGDPAQQFTLQGSGASTIVGTTNGHTTTVGFGKLNSGNGAPTHDISYYFANDSTLAAGSYTICTSNLSNCGSVSSSGLTGTLSQNSIPIASGTSSLQDSVITEDNYSAPTLLTISKSLALGSGSTAGKVTFNNASNNTNSISIAYDPSNLPTAPATIKLPTAGGVFAVAGTGGITVSSAGVISCSTCLGGGGGSGVASLNGATGPVTITNATGSGSTVTIQNAGVNGTNSVLGSQGLASFNGTDFKVDGGGNIDTIQGISTTSNPIFAGTTGLTLGSSGPSGGNLGQLLFKDGSTGANSYATTLKTATLSGNYSLTIPALTQNRTLAVSASGNLALDTSTGNLTISDSPNFGTSVTTPNLILKAGSTNTVSISSTQTNSTTLTIPDDTQTTSPVAHTDIICLQYQANCSGSGVVNDGGSSGNLNYITKFHTNDNGSVIAKSQIYDNGSFVGINTTNNLGQLSVVGPSSGAGAVASFKSGGSTGDLLDLDGGSGTVASFSKTGNLAFANTTSISTASTKDLTLQAGGTFLNLNASGANVASFSTNSLTFAQSTTVSTAPNISGVGNGQDLSFQGGITNTNGGTGGTLNLKGGSAGGTNSTGGSVGIDAGSGTTTGGQVGIGGTNASVISIGRSTGSNQPTINLQGNNINITNSNNSNAYSTSIGFSGTQQTSGLGNIVYNFDRSATAGTYLVCTTAAGSCQGTSSTAGGANNALSNLYNVAINTALLPVSTAGNIDVGSSSALFRTGYFGTNVSTPQVQAATGSALSLGSNGATKVILDNSGNLTFQQASTIGAAAQSSGNTDGTSVSVLSGAGYGTGKGGSLNLTGGTSGGGASGNGGGVNLQGGVAASTAGLGGAVSIAGGAANTTSGSSGGTGNGGTVTIQGGQAGGNTVTTSTGGAVNIIGGTATNGTGGSVTISGGTGSATQGSVIIKPGADSAIAFQIQNATNTATYMTVDTTSGSTQKIIFGTAANGLVLNANFEPILNGTAQHAKTILLTAEYAGAVLDPDPINTNNTGTMTAGYDSTNSTNRMNYYQWTTTSGSSQSYDVVVQVPIPSDFAGWASSNPFIISGYTSDTTYGTMAATITKSNGSADSNVNALNITPGSATAWANKTASALDSSGYTAGDYLTVRIRMNATSPATVRVGNIQLLYKSKY